MGKETLNIGANTLQFFARNPRGSHKDRHALIEEGFIGADGIHRIINHPLLHRLPFLLETPTDTEGHAIEIATLKNNIV